MSRRWSIVTVVVTALNHWPFLSIGSSVPRVNHADRGDWPCVAAVSAA